MKKYSIELRRIPNVPVGYGMDTFYDYKIDDHLLSFDKGIIFEYSLRYDEEPYTDGRLVVSEGWVGGEVKRSDKGWKFCDKVVYLDIYYHDNNSLLEENKKLKTEPEALSEKYNVGKPTLS